MSAGDFKGDWTQYHLRIRSEHKPSEFVPEHSTKL